MTRPSDLTQNDTIRIDREPLSGVTYEVMDKTTEDLGITEVVAVTLTRSARSGARSESPTRSDDLLSGLSAESTDSGGNSSDERDESVTCERYAIEWATHSETAAFDNLGSDSEWEISVTDIVLVEDE